MEQAAAFRSERDALHARLAPLDEVAFDTPTAFKGWTLNSVLQHLHFWNQMAGYQLTDEAKLVATLKAMGKTGQTMRAFETAHFDGLGGQALLAEWQAGYQSVADRYADADPKQRLKWAGPDMSARSSITARLMETWAHGQEVYDELGVVRQNADRIRNIVILGVNTYGWTFRNRGETPPDPMPYLALTAPSGEAWSFGEPQSGERIEGPAEAFCQVVTQTRNVADVPLTVTGPAATRWMAMAQCFAGPPEDPPAPGTRRTKVLQK